MIEQCTGRPDLECRYVGAGTCLSTHSHPKPWHAECAPNARVHDQACHAPQDENPANRPPFEDIVRWLRKLYYSSDGAGRDNRRSLDLNPWATN